MGEKLNDRMFWFAVGLEVIWAVICIVNKTDPQLWLDNAMYIGAGWGILNVGNKFAKKNGG